MSVTSLAYLYNFLEQLNVEIITFGESTQSKVSENVERNSLILMQMSYLWLYDNIMIWNVRKFEFKVDFGGSSFTVLKIKHVVCKTMILNERNSLLKSSKDYRNFHPQ